jgi:outer membrane murein-binding lipoprotein Lpp
MDGKWMTYADAAVRLGVSLEAARRRAIRGKWPRMPGNDGRTRVQVPDELHPLRTPDVRGTESEAVSEVVSALKSHIETLKTDIERLTAERQADRDELAAARAAADRATAELVELARRLAAIGETKAEPGPPRRKLGQAWRWFMRN